MKLYKLFGLVLAVVAVIIGANILTTYATAPTATTTDLDSGNARVLVYGGTFSTTITNVDTAWIYGPSGAVFNINGVGSFPGDSLITLEMYTSEATADSIRLQVNIQTTSVQSPNVTARQLNNATWFTVKLDSATFNNSKTFGIITFPKIRLAGGATKMRIVINEIGSTAKDANQTVTYRVVIPRYKAKGVYSS